MPLLSRKNFASLAYYLGVIMAVFQVYYTIGFGVLEGTMMRTIFLGFVMVLIFLLYPARKLRPGETEPVWMLLMDLCLAGVSVAIAAYICLNMQEIIERMPFIDPVSTTAKGLAWALIVLTLEITRRTTGWPLVSVAVLALIYMFLGESLPRAISHNGFTLDQIAEYMFLQGDGIYGVPIQVAANTLFAFIMFGAFLDNSKMGNIFMDIACLLTKKAQGGPAKVAIFASSLFGTITGSSAANVYATGTFTIPLMKKVGYSPTFAGAVEAVASTGGQLMPPIMGTAAFLMAELSGVGYLAVMKAGFFPALLYYFSLFVMIHFEAKSSNIGYLDPKLVPPAGQVLRNLYYLLPIIILIVSMLVGRSITVCANIATLSVLILSVFRKETRFTPKVFVDSLNKSAVNSLMVVACCACAGIIVGVVNFTGVGFKLINAITSLAGNNLFLLLVMLMFTSFVLGMGIPTTPAYIVVATLGAPALMKAGVIPIVAHMYVFYYAILSFITPPVCVAAFAGAAIAEADAMKTGFMSMKLAVVAFIVPFMFVYQPELIWQGDIVSVLIASCSALVGVVALSAAVQGWLLRRCSTVERLILLVAGVSLIYPGLLTDTIGVTGLCGVGVLQWLHNRRDPLPQIRPVGMPSTD